MPPADVEKGGRSTVEVLRAAKERISDPERWIRGALSDTLKHGADQDRLREGTCWCLSGAIGCESQSEDQWNEAVALIRAVVDQCVPDFNDGATHAEVLTAFDKAIDRAEAI